MEYEISDEDVLFDASTNPSLEKRHRQSVQRQAPTPPKRRAQKAEVIPEEEPEAA